MNIPDLEFQVVEETERSAPPVVKPLHILIADDSPVDRRIVTSILERRTHTVVAVENGVEALRALLHVAVHFDAAVLDFQMPKMDGSAVVQAVREEEQKTGRRMVIVTLSGAEPNARFQGNGADAHLIKPLDPWHLISTVEEWDEAAVAMELPQDPQRVVFDLGEAMARARGKTSLLVELVTIFLEDTVVQMEALREAIQTQNSDRIERGAHRIKGSAANVSAQRVADLAQRIELNARSGALPQAVDLWCDMESEVSRARKALAGFLIQNPKKL